MRLRNRKQTFRSLLMKKPLSAALSLSAAMLCAAVPAQANYYFVGPFPAQNSTIQSAINDAIAHAGDDEIRVRTGGYNDSLSVPASMAADQLKISGGWNADFSAQLGGGALDTFISPGMNERCGWLRPSGGFLTVSEFHFYGAQTDLAGAGLRIEPSGSAAVVVSGSVFDEDVLETSGNSAQGGAISANAAGGTSVALLGNQFLDNRAAVVSGTGAARGAAIDIACLNTSSCVITDNVILRTTAAARGSSVSGGAVSIQIYDGAVGQFERNLLDGVSVGPDGTAAYGRSMEIFTTGTSKLFARGNRIQAAASTGSNLQDEVRITVNQQASATVSDSLIAQSATTTLNMILGGSGNAYHTNLTLADDHRSLKASASSTGQPFLSNSILTTSPLGADVTSVVFSSNLVGVPVQFLAPSLYD